MKPRIQPFLRVSTAFAAAAAIVHNAQAADFTWGGGDGNWSDSNWNPGPVSGPTSGSDTATINSGTVSLNVGGMNIGSLTLGTGGALNAFNWNGANTYTAYNSLLLQGGTIDGIGNYQNWGAGILKNVTVSGSSPSTISASSFFNLNGTEGSSSVFDVADVTSDATADLNVTARLADVSAGSSWVAAALVKNGAGTLRLTAINDYTGGTTVNGGTLVLDGGTGGNARIRGALTVNTGATVTFANDDGTGLGWNGAAKLTSLTINDGTVSAPGIMHVWNLSGGITMTGGTLQSNGGVSDANGPQMEWINSDVTTLASANTAILGGRIRMRADGGAPGIIFDVADGSAVTDLLVSAAITEASGGRSITKNGAGTMKLTGYNTYTGATTVNAGTLELNGASGGWGLIRGAVTVNSSGTLALTGGDGTGFGWNSPISSLTVNGGAVNASGGAHIGFGGYTSVALNGGGTISGNWQWNGDSGVGFSSSGDSTNTISGNLTLRPDSGANHTFNVADGAAAVDLQITGNLSDQSPEIWWVSASNLVKSGNGTLVLSGNNSYDGATTVSAGRLVVNGNISTSSTTVQAGATLGGSGTVGAVTVQTDGIFAPGNSPGTLTLTGDLTLNSGSISDFEINSFSLGNYDLAIAAASGTQNVSFNGILNLLFQSGFNTVGSIKIFDFDGYSGAFTSIVPTGLASGFTASFDDATGIVTVVPEPAAALLGGLGMLCLLRRRRA